MRMPAPNSGISTGLLLEELIETTSRLNGGASKGLLSLRLERKSGPAGNRLDIIGVRE